MPTTSPFSELVQSEAQKHMCLGLLDLCNDMAWLGEMLVENTYDLRERITAKVDVD